MLMQNYGKWLKKKHNQQQWDKTDGFRSSCFWFKLEGKWHENFGFCWLSMWNERIETKIFLSDEIVLSYSQNEASLA